APFRADVGSRPHDGFEPALRDQLEESDDILSRIAVSVEIELAGQRLVPVPGNVKIDRVDPQGLRLAKGILPTVARQTRIEHRRGVDEEGLAVHPELRIRVRRRDLDGRRVRGADRDGEQRGREPEHRAQYTICYISLSH